MEWSMEKENLYTRTKGKCIMGVGKMGSDTDMEKYYKIIR